MDETPRTLIRELARPSTSPQRNNVPNINNRDSADAVAAPTGAARRQRGGGGAMSFGENETPRRLIARLATDLSTASDAAGDEGEESREDRRNRKKRRVQSTVSSTSATPKDARAAIRRFLRVAETDSREKSSQNRGDYDKDDWVPSEGDEGEEAEDLEEESEEEELAEGERHVAAEEPGPPTLIGLRRKPKQKAGEVVQRRLQGRVSGEIPYNKTVSIFRSFLGALPRPNRPTPQALEEAHAALNQYLDRSIRDYARLARIDDLSRNNLTKSRVEQLLREQGLLVRPVGDEIRRLLDREDADTTLGLPVSRARASRI